MEEEVVIIEENKKVRKWGLPFAIISFIVALVDLVPGYLSIIPLIGLAFAIITMIIAGVSIVLGIVGLIGTKVKWPSIVGISISALLIAWGLVRIFLLYTVISPIEFN